MAGETLAVTARIAGTGMNVPEQIISNDHFASYLDTNDEWIRERTGIVERRWVEGDVGVSELAEPAARRAIEGAGLTPEDIDGVIFATVTPDYVFPSSACFLQKRLGISTGFAFDINAVCSGFVYGLVNAEALISSGLCKNLLLVGADIYSNILDKNDRSTCILFGDGAGAVVLSAVSEKEKSYGVHGVGRAVSGNKYTLSGIYGSEICADGKHTDILCVPSGSAKVPTAESTAAGDHYLTMAGREVFKLAVRGLADINRKVIERAGFSPDDVDHFVSHQANKRILEAVAKNLKVSADKVPANIERYGNTSAASIPILLAEMDADSRLKDGDLVALSAFGGGVTWGAVLLRW